MTETKSKLKNTGKNQKKKSVNRTRDEVLEHNRTAALGFLSDVVVSAFEILNKHFENDPDRTFTISDRCNSVLPSMSAAVHYKGRLEIVYSIQNLVTVDGVKVYYSVSSPTGYESFGDFPTGNLSESFIYDIDKEEDIIQHFLDEYKRASEF